jgi:hypothetical protein
MLLCHVAAGLQFPDQRYLTAKRNLCSDKSLWPAYHWLPIGFGRNPNRITLTVFKQMAGGSFTTQEESHYAW